MALSYVTYLGNGSTTHFSVPFPYLFQSDVSVLVNGLPASYNWISPAIVNIAPAPPSGTTVLIKRSTNILNLTVVFVDGSTVEASDINTAELQALYLVQETADSGGLETQRATAAEAALQAQILGLTTPGGGTLSALFAGYLATLPTTLPPVAGTPWNDGGVVSLSQAT